MFDVNKCSDEFNSSPAINAHLSQGPNTDNYSVFVSEV